MLFLQATFRHKYVAATADFATYHAHGTMGLEHPNFKAESLRPGATSLAVYDHLIHTRTMVRWSKMLPIHTPFRYKEYAAAVAFVTSEELVASLSASYWAMKCHTIHILTPSFYLVHIKLNVHAYLHHQILLWLLLHSQSTCHQRQHRHLKKRLL